MTGDQLNANVDQYLQAAAMNTPPPQIVSDPLVTGSTPVEQLLRVLGLAANLGDAQDNADSTAEHSKRDAKTKEAAEKFAAQDEEAAQSSVVSMSNRIPPSSRPKRHSRIRRRRRLSNFRKLFPASPARCRELSAEPCNRWPRFPNRSLKAPSRPCRAAWDCSSSQVVLLSMSVASTPVDGMDAIPEDFGAAGGTGADVGGPSGGALAGGDVEEEAARGWIHGSRHHTDLAARASAGPNGQHRPLVGPTHTDHSPSAPATNGAVSTGMAGMPMVPPGAMAGATCPEEKSRPRPGGFRYRRCATGRRFRVGSRHRQRCRR
jgi:hypothetical protein